MRIPALKLPIKRGALLAAANWPVVVLQFIAEATFKILLAVPIVGGTFLVALALNQDVQDVLGDDLDLRASATGVATSLLEHPVALVSFLSALGIVVIGGSALMFILKGGTLSVLVEAQRHAGPLERYPVRLALLRRASRTDVDVFLQRHTPASATLPAPRRVPAGDRIWSRASPTSPSSSPATVPSARTGSWSAGPSSPRCAAPLLVAWLALVNTLYLVLQVIVAARDVSVRAAVGRSGPPDPRRHRCARSACSW